MTIANLTVITLLSLLMLLLSDLTALLLSLSFLPLLLSFYWWGLQQVMTLWSDLSHMSHQWRSCFADAITDLIFFCCNSWGAQASSCCICSFFSHLQGTWMIKELHRLSAAELRWTMSTEERATAKITAQVLMNRTWEKKGFKVRPWVNMQVLTWLHEMLLT